MYWDEDFSIKYISLPTTIHGCVVQDKNGYNTIYINRNIGIEEQRKALQHEVTHIARGDFNRPYVPLEELNLWINAASEKSNAKVEVVE